ncbi:hypothetical protein FNV43_RR22936 [Rhamnella rubrinervis]|uniref:Uncharacterized protein n=1 Tax=Rhamnella rubrinervis TaxID=2594499 RepID=A0A8K0DXJ2_9ROSA|nr:hypothetical protein FNV43_RR22936 [Rhamnella rubrinervis]
MEIDDDDDGPHHVVYVQRGMVNDTATFCSEVMGAERRSRESSQSNVIVMQLKYGSYIEIVEYNTNTKKACLTVMVDDVELSLGLARFRGAEMVGDVRGKILDPFGNQWMLVSSNQQSSSTKYKLFGFFYGLLRGVFRIWMDINTAVGAVVTTAIAGICLGYWLELSVMKDLERFLSLKLGHNLLGLPRWLIGFVFRIFRR